MRGLGVSDEIDFDIVEKLQAEIKALSLKVRCYRALVNAVEKNESGVICNSVMGIDWFVAKGQMKDA